MIFIFNPNYQKICVDDRIALPHLQTREMTPCIDTIKTNHTIDMFGEIKSVKQICIQCYALKNVS